MLVFINADSFNNQGTSAHHAASLLRTTMEAVERLQMIGDRKPQMYRDRELRDCRLAKDVRVKDAFAALKAQIKEQEQQALISKAPLRSPGELAKDADRFSKLLSAMTDAPLASEVFVAEQFESKYGDEDVSYKAPGYAAHFTRLTCEGVANTAVVVSLSEHPQYREPQITVLYGAQEQWKKRAVWNVAQPYHVHARRLRYDHNSKHPPAAEIKDFVSSMDLKSDEAQYVLDHAVALEGERPVFARYQGQIYIFPRHVDRHEQHPDSQALHHGYKVADPRQMRSRMVDVCNRLFEALQWPELKPEWVKPRSSARTPVPVDAPRPAPYHSRSIAPCMEHPAAWPTPPITRSPLTR